MIKACIIYYNEADFLPMMLKSIEGKVDEILAVDGKIKGFPGIGSLSSDGSSEIIEDCGGKIVGRGIWNNESSKRTVYFNAANTNDMLLIIDADELLSGQLPVIEDFYTMLVHSSYESAWRLRLVKKTDGIHYGNAHWEIIDKYFNYHVLSKKDTNMIGSWVNASIYHFDFLRSHDRKMRKLAFNIVRKDPIILRKLSYNVP